MNEKLRKVHVKIEFDTFTSLSPKQYPKSWDKTTNLGTKIKSVLLRLTLPRGIENYKIETSGEWEESH